MLTLPLLYHELRPEGSGYSYVMECARFAEHLELFAQARTQPRMLQPEITFDDGHRSNLDYALPILLKYSMVARFFITVGWTAKRTGYMEWADLQALHAAGQTIGAHGWTHTLLTHLDDIALDRELRGARETMEDHLGVPITSMSLPGGRFNRKVLAACSAAGYTQVWTSMPRTEPLPFGPLLGRLNIRANMTTAWLETLLRPETGVLPRLQRQQRIKDTAKALLGDRIYAKVWSVFNRQEQEEPCLPDTGQDPLR